MMDSLLLYKILKNRTGAEISASGNPAIMSDTLKNNPMNEMKVFGWSKQESTTGANLLDIDSMLNEFLVKNNDGTYSILKTETGRFSKSFPVNLTAGTVVRFDANVIDYNGTYNLPLQLSINYQTISAGTAITLDGDVSEVTIYQDAKNDVGTYTKFKNAILSIGRTQIPYEPYTGGKPSPNPDYPQQIVSAGNSGNIEVNVRGKNLVDVYGYSANDIPNPEAERALFNTYGTTLSTTEKTDKLIVHQEIIDGATADNYTSGYFCIGINRKLETEKDYIITFNINVIQNPFSVSTVFVLLNGIEAYKAEVIGDKVTVKARCEEYRERQYVEIRNCGMSLEISNFMITEENESTIYEPYYEPQTIPISTPTGLPAIPVDSDGNYTDANGQQWIADYVDLKRGKYVQNICDLPLKDINLKWYTWGVNANADNGTGFYVFTTEYARVGNAKVLATICRYNIGAWGGREIGCSASVDNSYITVSLHTSDLDDASDNKKAIESFKKIVDQTDAHVLYVRAEPIERDLTPEEIQAYKNLVTYAGTTIVENGAECYMEVSAGGGDSLRAKKLALILGD
ncbi:hypothetical protein [Dorea formicigenerans]|uniref:Uncharacterized protein n=1 Tax=Dorea formicigenerans TaxID=39486 RepID=A0A3E5GSL8_9FIRM|nr:hypothetical protein [Dorea formicigenerans]RGO50820.1 hypothetical protein DXB12_08395 [Dorea formicigenerans]